MTRPFINADYISVILVVVLTMLAQSVAAQVSQQKDSIGLTVAARTTENIYPNPKKAAIYSLIIPGAGQIYNKKYWKVPLLYGAMGGVVYLGIIRNRTFYRAYRDAYLYSYGNLETTPSETVTLLAEFHAQETLRLRRNRYDKNLQLSWIGLIVLHAVGAVDAYVDAQLFDFDVSDDLSLRIKPANFDSSTAAVGLSVQLTW